MKFVANLMMVLSAMFIVVGLKNFITATKKKNQKVRRKALLFMLFGVALLVISTLDSYMFGV